MMIRPPKFLYMSNDTGLLEHWSRSLSTESQIVVRKFEDLLKFNSTDETLVWIDLAMPNIPEWTDENWTKLKQNSQLRFIATSSNPKDIEAITALDAGCSAYCQAYSDASTLKQITQVVQAGHVWIGKTLMQRLIQTAGKVDSLNLASNIDWGSGLTQREREISILAANGASNQVIATDRHISERTVKAHLSSVFGKLNITDRLQLALRVHGIN